MIVLCRRGIRGNGKMLLRDKIAGGLVAFGAIGLAIAPLFGDQAALPANVANADVTVAITTGPQLQLLMNGEKRQFMQQTSLPQRDVVCDRVMRLIIADIGLRCRELRSTRNLALAQ